MKKKISVFMIVMAIVALAGWNVSQSRSEEWLSDVALENVEALADGESSSGTCYNTITTMESSMVLYCGTCTYIEGALSLEFPVRVRARN
jgi:membrane protein required for beta-lactamase induction